MGRILRWVGYAVGAVLLLAIVLWSVSRLRGATAEQEAALAVMEQPWQPQGLNAFGALWLLQYDVPEAAQAAILAEDARRLQARPVDGIDTDSSKALPTFDSVAKKRYRDLSPTPQDQAMLCKASEAGCLAKVRSSRGAYEALAARNQALLTRVAGLSRYDYYKYGFPPRIDAPIPAFQLGAATLTQHALELVRGDVDAALAGTCRDISTWRRLGANSDSLIARMIGIAYSTDGYGRLLADMLVELPREHPLPQSCSKALVAMSPVELSLCRPLQGEFRLSSSVADLLDSARNPTNSWFGNLMFTFFYDGDMTRAIGAAVFAPACSAAMREQILVNKAIKQSDRKSSLLRLECASNLVGCILSQIAEPNYNDYILRVQDQGARIQLLATLAWLRTQPQDGKPLAARLAGRPAELESPTRPVAITEDGAGIRIRQFYVKRGAYWRLPLPPYLWTKAGD